MLNRILPLVAVLLMIPGCQDETVGGPTPPTQDITVTPQTVEIAVGDSVQLSVQVQTVGDANPTITWQSGDTDIATVRGTPGDNKARVFGKSPGNTTVRSTAVAGSNSASDSASVTVVPDTAGGG